MHLTIIGQYGLPDALETTLYVAEEGIAVDGTAYDLSAVPDGGEGEWPDSPIRGKIKRIDGVIYATVRATFNAFADLSQTSQWVIENASGAITVPVTRKQGVPA